MFTFKPLTRRIIYVIVFEIIAVTLGSLILGLINDSSAHANLVIAIVASAVAMVWNFVFNSLFEAWERRTGRGERTLATRVLHTLGVEGGLIVFLVPIFMWWYDVGPLTALGMEAALMVFFLVFIFVFTFLFDKAVKTYEPERTCPAT